MFREHRQIPAQVGVLDLVGLLELVHVLFQLGIDGLDLLVVPLDFLLHPLDPLPVPVQEDRGGAQGGQEQERDGQEALQLPFPVRLHLLVGVDDVGQRLVDFLQADAGVGAGGVVVGPGCR